MQRQSKFLLDKQSIFGAILLTAVIPTFRFLKFYSLLYLSPYTAKLSKEVINNFIDRHKSKLFRKIVKYIDYHTSLLSLLSISKLTFNMKEGYIHGAKYIINNRAIN